MIRNYLNMLLRKFRTLLLIVLAVLIYPFIFILMAVFCLLRPFVLVRLVRLETGRIGHFSGDTEIYLCERDAGLYGNRVYDIFYHTPYTCNKQLKKMWDRTLRISYVATLVLDRIKDLLPGAHRHIIIFTTIRDLHGLTDGSKSHISFTADEERKGLNALRKLGLPEDASIVCIYARDPAYMNALEPNEYWGYNDYRNTDIYDFVSAAEALGERGYHILRLGSIVEKPLITSNPKILDYATVGRTDFLDIFLCERCRFFLGTSSGVSSVALMFRRPIAYVNFIPMEYMPAWSRDHIFILKKLWLRREKRFMTFREILDSGVGRICDQREYDRLEIELVDNTPEEIRDLALEIDNRIRGVWHTKEEDEVLQRRFSSLFKPNDINGVFLSRIGADFLRQNKELLE